MLIPTTALFTLLSLAPGAPSPKRSDSRPHRCVIPSSNGTDDDSLAITRTSTRCSSDSVVVFREGVDYNVFQPISATNLSNVETQTNGNLHLPQNITAVQEIVNGTGGTLYWNGQYSFTFSGPRVDYIGSADVNNGWINSYGQAWWDANPANGTGIDDRPHLMSFKTTHGSLKHFKSRKPIAWNVQLKGDDIDVSHALIDAESTDSFPFNTMASM